MKTLRVLMVGDVVGAAGRAIFQKHIDKIKSLSVAALLGEAIIRVHEEESVSILFD